MNGNEELKESAAQKILELEYDNVGCCTLLSNVKAGVGRRDEVEEARNVMREGFQEETRSSCIVVRKVENRKFRIAGLCNSQGTQPI